jgi:hypothetical protein
MKMHTRIGLTLAAVSALGTALVVSPSGMASAQLHAAVITDPTTGTDSCDLIDFDSAQYVIDPVTGSQLLEVSGVAPYAGMKVVLEPLVYLERPEYWGVEVMGCLPQDGFPVMTPYTATLDLELNAGTVGMEVIGANVRLEVPYVPVGDSPFN